MGIEAHAQTHTCIRRHNPHGYGCVCVISDFGAAEYPDVAVLPYREGCREASNARCLVSQIIV